MCKQSRNRLTERENKLTITKGRGRGEGQIRGMGLTDTIHKIDKHQACTL